MGYIPDSKAKQQEMLKVVGVNSIDDLFHQVPQEVKLKELDIPEGRSELSTSKVIK